MRRLGLLTSLCVVCALVSCSDPAGPPPVKSVELVVQAASMVEGTTQQLSVTLKDASGSELTDRTVAYSTNNAGVLTVYASGLVAANAPGAALLIATSERVSDTVSLTVTPIPVVSVIVTGAVSMLAGNQEQLAAVAHGANNVTLAGRQFTWATSAGTVATVNAAGKVTAVGPGFVTITATSEGVAGQWAMSVAPCGVTSVSPTVVVPGSNATILGACFGLGAAHTVSIRGIAAPVLSTAAGQIVVSVPCVASGSGAVIVSTGGIVSPAYTATMLAPQVSLATGQAAIRTSSGTSACNEISQTGPAGRYLVAVYSTATSAATQTGFELGGSPVAAGQSAVRVPVAQPRSVQLETAPVHERLRDDAHFAHLERERAEYSRAMSRFRATGAAPAVAASEAPALGAERDIYFTFASTCGDVSKPMHSKVVYSGTRAVIWEDTENTLQTSSNAVYAGYMQRLGQIFDQDQYESVRTNFGDPLLRDPLTDADGRVHMVFSQKLNPTTAAAFVTSCDMFPRSQNAASNVGEFFYGEVPTNAALNINTTASPDGWFYFMARTIVHEVKHIASLSARIANSAPTFEASWLEEGTARHAEEMWVRESLHHVAWKANSGFGTALTNGILCDFHPTDATCNAADALRRPSYGMRRHFNEIRPKLLAPWDYSPFGEGAGQSGSTFYQTSWSLVRYAIDRYATSEPLFFKALVNSSTNGVTNLSTAAGVSLDQLIGGWSLALFADDYPGIVSPSPDLQFPTWNLRSIYAGLNASPNWTSAYPNVFPMQPTQLVPGSFSTSLTALRGGAAAYFEITGLTGTQILSLRAPGGGPPSANLRIAVARLQ